MRSMRLIIQLTSFFVLKLNDAIKRMVADGVVGKVITTSGRDCKKNLVVQVVKR